MSFLQDLFSKPYPSEKAPEVERLLAELVQIGKRDDFLAERPTAGYNHQLRHVRSQQIGQRLDEIGGLALMEYAHRYIRRKCSKILGEHLEYCWDRIGKWRA